MSNKTALVVGALIFAAGVALTACSNAVNGSPVQVAPPTAAPVTPPPIAGPVVTVTASQLRAGFQAYRDRFYAGTMVVLLGPSITEGMMEQALSIGVPSGDDHQLQAVGARLRPDGTVSTFSLIADAQTDASTAVAELANEEFALVPPTIVVGTQQLSNAPDVLAWTPIDDDVMRIEKGNEYVEDRWSTYRLNSISRDDDWYLFTDRVESRGSKNNPIKNRSERFQLLPNAELIDHGPTTVNKVTTQRFQIGGELGPVLGEKSGVFGKVNALWSQSWTTYAVETTDYSTNQVGRWVDEFDGSQQASRGNYVSDVAAIFKSPKRDEVLNYNMSISFDRTTGGNASATRSFRASAPFFSVTPRQLSIRPDSDAWIVVQSGVKDEKGNVLKLLRFTTEGSQIPTWLALERGGANHSCSFLIHANPDAKPGDIGVLQFDSVPPFAARSLESGPQTVVLGVVERGVSPSPTPSSNPKPCGT